MDKQSSPKELVKSVNIKLPRENMSIRKRKILDGEECVERILAKKTKGNENLFFVKWHDLSMEESTWEPERQVPSLTVQQFEFPSPHLLRIADARERIALVLERGLKTVLQYTETIEMKHEVVRAIFPKIPSELSTKPYLADKQDLEDAGLKDYLERTVTLAGGRRRVEFPMEIELVLGSSPKFCPDQGRGVYKTRPVEKLRIAFLKEHL